MPDIMPFSRSESSGGCRSSAKTTTEFLEEVRAFMRVRRFSLRTEESYRYYIERSILGVKSPLDF
jgi:hypothetical protein